MGTVYIISTPIGNLEDVSLRALRVLKEVNFVLCEDTRVTRKLLSHYEIHTPTLSYHQHSTEKEMARVFDLLSQGKNIALVSDAGTPGISDPGNELIAFLIKRSSELKIIPIPGPSALTAGASIAGFPMDKFLFLGFPPHKKKRKKFFEEIAQSQYPVIFYESPYRIIKSLQELASTANDQGSSFKIVVCRELTKKFETVYRGTIEEVLEQLHAGKVRGEFVIVAYQEK